MSFCGMRGTVPCSVAAGRGGSCPGSYCGPCTDHLAPWCALPTLCKESQPGPRRKPDMRPMCAVAAAFVLTLFHEARDRVVNSRGTRNVKFCGLGSYKGGVKTPLRWRRLLSSCPRRPLVSKQWHTQRTPRCAPALNPRLTHTLAEGRARTTQTQRDPRDARQPAPRPDRRPNLCAQTAMCI